MSAKALLSASVSAGPAPYVEDVFSTYLYTGNGSTQTITNGIDLSGEGGLVWLKKRSDTDNHVLIDTERWDSTQNFLNSNTTSSAGGSANGITSFNSDGFSLSGSLQGTNSPGAAQASWTFRKAEKFFDVVTYVGDGNTTKTVSHNLGSVPGSIIAKGTSAATDWPVYHRSLNGGTTPEQWYLGLNSTAAQTNAVANWGNVAPTSTTFTVGGNNNANGISYVAYLFAHDAGGFGDTGTDSVVSCGSYTGNGTTYQDISLGWEPQWVLIKCSSSAQSDGWILVDNMRDMSDTGNAWLYPNTSGAETSESGRVVPTATGFKVSSNTAVNTSSATYIYIAIRRGPMRTPESGTEVFSQVARTGTGSAVTITGTGFAPDALIYKSRSNAVDPSWQTRLQGGSPRLASSSTAAESADNELDFGATMDGIRVLTGDGVINLSSWTYINYFLRRAPGFFDVVAYTGDSSKGRSIPHNLAVAPEMIIVKRRTASTQWTVYHAKGNNGTSPGNLYLDATNAATVGDLPYFWGNETILIAPTSSVFTVNAFGDYTNGSGSTYIAYLFATAPGVSKVGSYTGTGTTFNIDCGFTAGARFVMIKRTDSTGDWYVWDTARGIISGDDPYLLLNSTAAEVTNTDYIDPLSSGFQISSTAPAAINASGGSFIFLAIA
jgi:hypothetical protein